MTKIDIFSGFLGAGKTTLIKKLIKEAYIGEKLVLIENEFGEIGIDGGFLKDAGINITEMNSGCICCSLVGDFETALKEVIVKFSPDRIIIEPSGVGKLGDVIKAVKGLEIENVVLNCAVTVADAKKCKMYIKNFGEFYNNQLEHADTIILSRTGEMSEAAVSAALTLMTEKNEHATYIVTDWDKLSGKQILDAMEKTHSVESELEKLAEEDVCTECGHHNHEHECEHDHGEHSECEHHKHHDEHTDCHHKHSHEHHHDGHCCCGHHEHEHHHHHADEVFDSIGYETAANYTEAEFKFILEALNDADKYGAVLRAKGYVADAEKNTWLHFDFVPGEINIREGGAEVIGRICVIGSNINKNAIEALFKI